MSVTQFVVVIRHAESLDAYQQAAVDCVRLIPEARLFHMERQFQFRNVTSFRLVKDARIRLSCHVGVLLLRFPRHLGCTLRSSLLQQSVEQNKNVNKHIVRSKCILFSTTMRVTSAMNNQPGYWVISIQSGQGEKCRTPPYCIFCFCASVHFL